MSKRGSSLIRKLNTFHKEETLAVWGEREEQWKPRERGEHRCSRGRELVQSSRLCKAEAGGLERPQVCLALGDPIQPALGGQGEDGMKFMGDGGFKKKAES